MNITDVNNTLKKIGKPAAKIPAVANKPADMSNLKARIVEARKSVGVVFGQAQKLGAHEIADKTRKLSQELITLEADLGRISGVERKLVRMITRFS